MSQNGKNFGRALCSAKGCNGVMVDNSWIVPYNRDIILRRRNGPLVKISDLHPAYTPLYYVLLFPYSEPGWHPDLRLNEPDKEYPARLTQTHYVAYLAYEWLVDHEITPQPTANHGPGSADSHTRL
ncbi:hypothetical protein B0H11DRAFT_2347307 [Mycena galericulata]|nr:hypothetical protein B0H11DRAFT_2347307 [Mycena galericulata]